MQKFGSRPRLLLESGVLAVAILVFPLSVAAQHDHQSPYAGHEAMEVSSLSPDELRELRAGEGMGLARAAELNHFPGPKHALELAVELQLSTEQVQHLTEIRRRMLASAIAKGAEIIAAEGELTDLFRGGDPDETSVGDLTQVLGKLYGELRAIHLAAHLTTVEVMTPTQVEVYDGLRGYGV